MKKSDRAKKQTAKVIEAAARAHEALDYFNGNVTNPFDELTWPSIAEGYLLVAQKAVSADPPRPREGQRRCQSEGLAEGWQPVLSAPSFAPAMKREDRRLWRTPT